MLSKVILKRVDLRIRSVKLDPNICESREHAAKLWQRIFIRLTATRSLMTYMIALRSFIFNHQHLLDVSSLVWSRNIF